MSPWPVINNGVAAVLYCFIWLYFSAAGADRGAWMQSGESEVDGIISTTDNPL